MSTDTITEIALEQLHESPFNPRQIYAGLDELAANITAEGRILQPLQVRPIVPPLFNGDPDATAGYEIVFGHRRLRAAQLAGLASVPCMVRSMSDAEVRSAQASENLEREDVHPFEEAEAFRSIVDAGDATADQLAERFGKSRTYVFSRLKLLQACPEVRQACLAGEVGAEVALLVARLRTPALQAKALASIKSQHLSRDLSDGGKSSYRSIRNLLNEKFTLELKQAIFPIDDATLLHDAGTCFECPKRSANAPEFADIAVVDKSRDAYGMRNEYIPHDGADVCTDPDCFAAKKAAHLKRQAAVLAEKGKTVVDGHKARQAISATGEVKGAYVALKDVREQIKKLKGRKTLAGKPVEPPATVTIQDPRSGKTVEAVKLADLEAAGIKPAAPKKSGGNDAAFWQRQRERDEAKCQEATGQRVALLGQIRERMQATERSEFDLRLVAAEVLDRVDYDDLRLLHQLWGMAEGQTLEERVPAMDAGELTRLLMDCVLVKDLVVSYLPYAKQLPSRLQAAAEFYGVSTATASTPSPAARAAKAAKPAKAKGRKKEVTDDAGDAGERTAESGALFEEAQALAD